MMEGVRPALIAHADWSKSPKKRWLAQATLHPDGRYCVDAVRPADSLDDLWRWMEHQGASHALVGFDFPIGVPATYAHRAGVWDFVAALPGFGSGRFADFYRVACQSGQIGIERPFYPQSSKKGSCRNQLVSGLGFADWTQMLRRCDRRTSERPAACALFWTLGPQQVGKAAIAGWHDLLTPALKDGRDVALWPFQGSLEELLARHRCVVAETYPAEVYRHLGLDLAKGKGKQEVRRANAGRLLSWAKSAGLDLRAELVDQINDGFGAGAGGDDGFDAVVGLFGMIQVVLGCRASGEPTDDEDVRRVEGWILGQDGEVSLRADSVKDLRPAKPARSARP